MARVLHLCHLRKKERKNTEVLVLPVLDFFFFLAQLKCKGLHLVKNEESI